MKEQKKNLGIYVRDLVKDLYRNGERISECLGEHVTWIGEKKLEIFEGAEVVRRYLKKQEQLPMCKMGKNSFRIVWKGNDAVLVEGIYILEPMEEEGFLLKNSQRCSVLLQKKKEKYEIVHLHISDCHENIVWRRDLIAQIQRDPLTQIYNVKTVKEKVEQWLKKGAGQQGCAMCLIDIDNFKNINDTLGHLEGNDILIQVAQVLKSTTGKNGFAGRAGGDEFLVFLKNGSQNQIEEFVSILMEKVRKGDSSSKDSMPGNTEVTISIGIARISTGTGNRNISYKHLFRQADTALYMAKKKGKNTFHILNIEKQQTP